METSEVDKRLCQEKDNGGDAAVEPVRDLAEDQVPASGVPVVGYLPAIGSGGDVSAGRVDTSFSGSRIEEVIFFGIDKSWRAFVDMCKSMEHKASASSPIELTENVEEELEMERGDSGTLG